MAGKKAKAKARKAATETVAMKSMNGMYLSLQSC
jgi:hypothetical protein